MWWRISSRKYSGAPCREAPCSICARASSGSAVSRRETSARSPQTIACTNAKRAASSFTLCRSGDARAHPRVAVVEVGDGVAGMDDLVEAGGGPVVEAHVEDGDGLLEVGDGARPDDGRGHVGLVLAPEQRELAGRQADVAGDGLHLLG